MPFDPNETVDADCDGGWRECRFWTIPIPSAGVGADAVMSVTDAGDRAGSDRHGSLEVTGAEGFNALDASLTYDPAILSW